MKHFDKIISRAKKEALKSNMNNRRHAVVIFTSSGQIVCSGHNTKLKDGESIHAEESGVFKIPKNVNRGKLYLLSYRMNNNYEERNAKPCERCTVLINRSGIKNVLYTTG